MFFEDILSLTIGNSLLFSFRLQEDIGLMIFKEIIFDWIDVVSLDTTSQLPTMPRIGQKVLGTGAGGASLCQAYKKSEKKYFKIALLKLFAVNI